MFVFTNHAISLDGKLALASRETLRLGSAEDLQRMSLLRARADAVLVGGRTWRAWSLPLVEDPAVVQQQRERPVVNAVLTRSGKGPRAGRFFEHPGTLPVFFGGADTDLSGFPPTVRLHRAGGAQATLPWVLGILERDHGVQRLLVEGGGEMTAQLLEADLLHELHVTLCPWLLGGRDAPTLVDGAGFAREALRRLDLVGLERVDQEIYLQYRVVPRRGAA